MERDSGPLYRQAVCRGSYGVAVSALSGAELEQSGMRDILKLSQIVPNLEFNTGGAIIYATNKPNEELEGHVEVNADWYSEELRLNGSAFDGEVDLVVGLFASREKTDAGITVGGLSESLDFVTGVTALPLVGATQSTGITWSDPRTYGVELAYT